MSIPLNSTCTQLLILNDPLLHNESLLFKLNTQCAHRLPMLSTQNSIKLYDHVYLVCLVMLQQTATKSGLDLNEDKRPFLVYMFYVSNKILL